MVEAGDFEVFAFDLYGHGIVFVFDDVLYRTYGTHSRSNPLYTNIRCLRHLSTFVILRVFGSLWHRPRNYTIFANAVYSESPSQIYYVPVKGNP